MSWISKLFKKEEYTSEHVEIIYRNKLTLNGMYLGPGRLGPLVIFTYLMKVTGHKRRVEYEIKQRLPLTEKPFYDGDFTTNRIIERYGRSEWSKAEFAINEDKIKNQSKQS